MARHYGSGIYPVDTAPVTAERAPGGRNLPGLGEIAVPVPSEETREAVLTYLRGRGLEDVAMMLGLAPMPVEPAPERPARVYASYGHGTEVNYRRRGCRCDPCREAATAAGRRRRAARVARGGKA